MKKLLIISLLLLSVGLSQRPERNEIISERHPNGLKKLVNVFQGTGINETLVGKYGFYDSGIKEFVEFYKNNKKDGKSLYWYGNGNQKRELNYVDGKMNGPQIEWYEDGKKKIERYYKNDEINDIKLFLDGNGDLSTLDYIDNMRKRGNINELIPIMRDLVSIKNELSSTIQYKIGDIYMEDLRDFETSIIEYKKVGQMFPGSSQEPEGLFMIGYIYTNVLQDLDKGENEYQNFLKKFPNHELAPSVNFELDNMGLSIEELQKKGKL